MRLFRILGFDVRVDASWLLLALLIAWTTAQSVFGPEKHEELSPAERFGLGLLAAVGLLLSIVFHELSHSVVARAKGMQIKGITLFLFGGVAEMHDEPQRPRDELYMAIVGPLSSFVFAGLAWLARAGLVAASVASPIQSLLSWLIFINVLLGIFNLIPAFPLDGGRVLRAILWEIQGDIRRATRVASTLGSGFGLLLIAWGAFIVLLGQPIAGVWSILIGLFLRTAAKMPYRQLVARQVLAGETVRRFMVAAPIVVPRATSVAELVSEYIYRHQRKLFPVVDGERLIGTVSLEQVQSVPRDEWRSRTVGEIAEPVKETSVIGPDGEAVDALARMSRLGVTRLLVVESDRLVGVLTLSDLLNFLALHLELEDR